MDTSSLVTLTFNWMSKLIYGSSNNEQDVLLIITITHTHYINGYEN